MPNVTVSIDCSALQKHLDELRLTQEKKQELLEVWGRLAVRQLFSGAIAQGGKRFWRECAGSIAKKCSGNEVILTADYRAIHMQYGGTLLPKRAKCLAIPIFEAVGTGKLPREYALDGKKLFQFKSKKGGLFLGYADEQGVHALFVLKDRVDNHPRRLRQWYDPKQVADVGIAQIEAFLKGGVA